MPLPPPWDDPLSLPLPDYLRLFAAREAALDILNNAPDLGRAILARRLIKGISLPVTLKPKTVQQVKMLMHKHKGGRPASRPVGFQAVQLARLQYQIRKKDDQLNAPIEVRAMMAEKTGISLRSLETVLADNRNPSDDLDDLVLLFVDDS